MLRAGPLDLVFMAVSWVIFTAVHTVARSSVIAWTLPDLAGSM